MITTKYKNIYDEFVNSYENIHINPWHEISKSELNQIADYLISTMEINDEVSFYYFINFLIKRLNGKTDAHTSFNIGYMMPFTFKIIGNRVFLEENKYELKSINGIGINIIMNEIDSVISYGNLNARRFFMEFSLRNRLKLLGLPSLRNSEKLDFMFEDEKFNVNHFVCDSMGAVFKKCNIKEDINCSFKQIDNNIVYIYNSCLDKYKLDVINSVEVLKHIDLSNVNNFIVDLRDNAGGNSTTIDPLIEFLKSFPNLNILILTNYRIFSSGSIAIDKLRNIGGISIGSGIATPMNCYGHANKIKIDNYFFHISSKYIHINPNLYISNRGDFNHYVSRTMLEDDGEFLPDIEIEETAEDFLNDVDPYMNYALTYDKSVMKK